jgi:hypothetical protein
MSTGQGPIMSKHKQEKGNKHTQSIRHWKNNNIDKSYYLVVITRTTNSSNN